MEENQVLMHFYFTTPSLNILKVASKVEFEKNFADLQNWSFMDFALNLSQVVDLVMFIFRHQHACPQLKKPD